jgi:hypothetical protein
MPRLPIACLLAVLGSAAPAPGFIHVPPTDLRGVCRGVSWIRVLTVQERNEEKGGVTFDVKETLRENRQWKSGVASHRRLVVPADAPGAKAVLKRLGPGTTVVLFSSEGEGETPFAFGYACYGEGWYSVQYSPPNTAWVLLRHEPDLSRCYHGDGKKLPGFVAEVLAGKKQIDEAIKKARGEK